METKLDEETGRCWQENEMNTEKFEEMCNGLDTKQRPNNISYLSSQLLGCAVASGLSDKTDKEIREIMYKSKIKKYLNKNKKFSL